MRVRPRTRPRDAPPLPGTTQWGFLRVKLADTVSVLICTWIYLFTVRMPDIGRLDMLVVLGIYVLLGSRTVDSVKMA